MPFDPVKLLADFVRIPSPSGEEGQLADYVEKYARAAGVPVGREDDNVYLWIGDGPHTLMLNSHLDVVPPSEGHPYDPFDPVEVDGELYGRGAVDAKASGAAMMAALLGLARQGWSPERGKVLVALTTCEETGGAYNGLESLLSNLPPVSAALVGEPTSLRPCIAQKGLLILTALARGRTAHAARAHRGTNAIHIAVRDLQRLEGLTFSRKNDFLGGITLTPTTISGGSARNVVPDRCSFTMDIRTTPEYTHDEITTRISDLLESDVEVYSDRIAPVSTPLSARIVRACREALPESEPFGSPTASDWIFLRDTPTVKIGPGDSRLSHTPDERIPVEEVRRAARVYERIIRTYYADH